MTSPNKRHPPMRAFIVTAAACLLASVSSRAQETPAATTPEAATVATWPQQIDAAEGKIVIYQPQPEKLAGNQVTGRAAMSLQVPSHPEPIFGAFWFTARLDTDSDAGLAYARDIKITKVHWPDAKEEYKARFTQLVESALPTAGYEISQERLSASLATAERERKSFAAFKNEPPKILFSEELAVLLSFDGPPNFAPLEKSAYERAINTPLFVARSAETKVCFMSNGSTWYTATDPLGTWMVTTAPPSDLVALMPKSQAAPAAQPATTSPTTSLPSTTVPPLSSSNSATSAQKAPTPERGYKIVPVTAPSEMVSTDGAPVWKSLPGGQLLYAENTETHWIRDTASGKMYLLISGRWFSATTQQGPWTFERPDQLPESFKSIPPDSDIGVVRTWVAGTEEAEAAVLDASVPQTAAIKRSEAKLTVNYNGEPEFAEIPGTKVAYARNTQSQVLRIGASYYAVDSGVWFTSQGAKGPWVVADKIPKEEIAKIPPSSPVYNVTYVEVYESTPEVVYVGYTPGYMWSYPYYGVPIYGTGWYYPPYVSHHVYYPYVPTWGMHVGYNPWTGWSFGCSWTVGFMTIGVAWGGGYPCCGGYYGGGYRPPMYVNRPGGIGGVGGVGGVGGIGGVGGVGRPGGIGGPGGVNIGNRVNRPSQLPAAAGGGNRVQNLPSNGGGNNVYNRAENRARVADRAPTQRATNTARPATGQSNNVYADRNGNIARNNGNTWESRQNNSWQQNNTRNQRSQTDFNNAQRARNSGASREMSRSAPRMGGGGRRR